MSHVPVLLNESVDGLDIQPTDIVVDATLGGGGHSQKMAPLAKQVIGFDLDTRVLALATEKVPNIIAIKSNFRHLEKELQSRNITPTKALFDLGVSSMEFGPSGRGFTFSHDEPLLMTLSDTEHEGHTAYEIVNSYSEKDLADLIYTYGEERASRRIAKAIVEKRKQKPIATTFELADTITEVMPRRGRIHPATRTFQALRIATNDELGALEEGLRSMWNILPAGGRIAVISFHSLEDRIVKHLFKEFAKESGHIITKKPITPSREEIQENPRSRSAKLRIIQK